MEWKTEINASLPKPWEPEYDERVYHPAWGYGRFKGKVNESQVRVIFNAFGEKCVSYSALRQHRIK